MINKRIQDGSRWVRVDWKAKTPSFQRTSETRCRELRERRDEDKFSTTMNKFNFGKDDDNDESMHTRQYASMEALI